jgi:hypothetical protein
MSRAEFATLPRVIVMRKLRVRVEVKGFRTRSLVIVTNLLDPVAFPRQELAGLYRARWHGELDLRSIEQTMKMDVLRCLTPDMVRKEFSAHVLGYNLVRGVMAAAAWRQAVAARCLSFQEARQALESFRGPLSRATPVAKVVLREVALRVIAHETVGDRPDCVEPRIKKRRPKAYPRMHQPRLKSGRRVLGAAKTTRYRGRRRSPSGWGSAAGAHSARTGRASGSHHVSGRPRQVHPARRSACDR